MLVTELDIYVLMSHRLENLASKLYYWTKPLANLNLQNLGNHLINFIFEQKDYYLSSSCKFWEYVWDGSILYEHPPWPSHLTYKECMNTVMHEYSYMSILLVYHPELCSKSLGCSFSFDRWCWTCIAVSSVVVAVSSVLTLHWSDPVLEM